MKKFLLIFVILVGTLSSCNTIEAQSIGVNVSINIGRQPAWGPIGYDYVDYYYFPDINCYFNVNLDLFYYFHRGRWVAARYLPYSYCDYDLYGMYKVVLVGIADPWHHNTIHIRDYGRYKGHRNQPIIRDSHDVRYSNSRNNKVVWYSEKKSNDNRNNANRNNNNINSGNNHRQGNSNGNRNSQSGDNKNYNNHGNNNGNNHNNNINDHSNNNGNNHNNNINNRGNNNEKKDVTVRKQQNNTDNKDNKQPQRNSDNKSLSGRSNNDKKDSGTMRSGSSGRSQGHEGRTTSTGDRRGRR